MSIGIALSILCAAAFAQNTPGAASAAPQKPAAAAPKLAGFPFQDETLRYSIKWPSGLSLGDAVFTAHQTQTGWNLQTSIDAGIPGFSIKDDYKSAVSGADLCSAAFERSLSHGSKKTAEKTTFDQRAGRAQRVTTLPKDGGKTDFDIPSCG